MSHEVQNQVQVQIPFLASNNGGIVYWRIFVSLYLDESGFYLVIVWWGALPYQKLGQYFQIDMKLSSKG